MNRQIIIRFHNAEEMDSFALNVIIVINLFCCSFSSLRIPRLLSHSLILEALSESEEMEFTLKIKKVRQHESELNQAFNISHN
jgi:hypothetical protein